ncbi:MAG TPA: hypothetical protein ENI16_00065 [Candidatus Portnoybacteria bacterium]|nr:hypothetical protein [Candidatus Portnoybacteria bacterium]
MEKIQALPDLLASLNLSSPSWDLLILIFFIVGTLLYGISLGRNRTIVILVSIYMSLALVETFPLVGFKIAEIRLTGFSLKMTVFLGALILIFLLLSRSGLRRIFRDSRLERGAWWQTFVFSFFQVGLLISTILSFSSPRALANFSSLTQDAFTSDIGRFLWVLLPILAMILVRGKRRGN